MADLIMVISSFLAGFTLLAAGFVGPQLGGFFLLAVLAFIMVAYVADCCAGRY